MPELPDIAAYLTALEPRVVGQALVGVRRKPVSAPFGRPAALRSGRGVAAADHERLLSDEFLRVVAILTESDFREPRPAETETVDLAILAAPSP